MMLTELFHRVGHFFGRRGFDNDLEAEVQFHIETRADELEAAGMTRSAALVAARREFGSAARMQEETRAAWRFGWIEDLASDLRYAARGIRRNPGFAVTAIACLALGIGANTTIFSVAREALLNQPSARDPQSLVYIRIGGMSHSPMKDYRFLRDAQVFDGLAGENEEAQINWRAGDTTARIASVQVTDNYFDVTGTPFTMGRGIQPGEEDTVVVGWRFWQRRLGGDPDVLGRKLILDGRPCTVVGVLTKGHRTMIGRGFAPEIFVRAPERASVSLYARIPPGMTRPVVQSRITAAARELDRLDPRPHPRANSIKVTDAGGLGRLTGEAGFMPVTAFFGMLMTVVTLVLLIACANVASLLLARASGRAHELAVRISIGAGRGRVIRQLLAESLLLGLSGAAAGLWINIAAVAALGRLDLPLPIPIHLDIQTDWRLLGYAAAVGIASSAIAGLAPALQGTRQGIAAVLKRDQRQIGERWSLRNLLVAGQLAISIVLLCAGFIFLRNLAETTGMNPGFDIDHAVWASMRLPDTDNTPERMAAAIEVALATLRAIPGVQAAALMKSVPMNQEISIGAEVKTQGKDPVHAMWYQNDVSPDYFHAMGIPLVGGRDFARNDRDVAILSENFARRVFGNASPVGRTIETEPFGRVTIIGVARNSCYMSFSDRNALAMYVPYTEDKLPGAHKAGELEFMVRSAASPESVIPAIRTALDRVDPSAAVEARAMKNALTMALVPSQAGALVLGSVGLLGLGLASVGLYGVLLYAVSRRIREIGLRVALGASPAIVLKLVLQHSLGLVGAGLGVGMALAFFAVRPLAMFVVPNIKPTDPLNFLTVAAVLCVVALVATVAPAVRALRVDPLTALRHE